MKRALMLLALAGLGCPSNTELATLPAPPPVRTAPERQPPITALRQVPVKAPPLTAREPLPTISVSEFSGSCLFDPPPIAEGNADAYQPAPYETCLNELHSIRPLPVFDAAATAEARRATSTACCYRFLGNR